MRKLILAGGSGFIGQALIDFFSSSFDEIVILTRNKASQQGKLKYVNWDGVNSGEWVEELSGAEVVVNLTGKNINCRFNTSNKKQILDSRVHATHAIGKAIQSLKNPPKTWINFSATAIYKTTFSSEPQNEFSSDKGVGFMYEVCEQWESAFNSYTLETTRKLILRASMVMGKNAGVVKTLLPIMKSGLGGKVASGKQMVSWIHQTDLCRLINWLIETNHCIGVYNASAPHPVSNTVFMENFRKSVGVSIGIPAPLLFVKMGTFVLGTDSSLILDSVNVLPTKSVNEGFEFNFKTIDSCFSDLLH